MSKFTVALRSILPVKFVDEAEQVPAAIQAEIDKINRNAAANVATLRSQHSVATKKSDVAQRRGWAKAVFDDYERMLAAEEDAATATAVNVLPPLNLGPTGPTGASGPSA